MSPLRSLSKYLKRKFWQTAKMLSAKRNYLMWVFSHEQSINSWQIGIKYAATEKNRAEILEDKLVDRSSNRNNVQDN